LESAARRGTIDQASPVTASMIRLDRLGVFVPLPTVTLDDVAAAVRVLLALVPSWGIYVAPLSDEWRRQHERDTAKR
jgi:hypothetical protein